MINVINGKRAVTRFDAPVRAPFNPLPYFAEVQASRQIEDDQYCYAISGNNFVGTKFIVTSESEDKQVRLNVVSNALSNTHLGNENTHVGVEWRVAYHIGAGLFLFASGNSCGATNATREAFGFQFPSFTYDSVQWTAAKNHSITNRLFSSYGSSQFIQSWFAVLENQDIGILSEFEDSNWIVSRFAQFDNLPDLVVNMLLPLSADQGDSPACEIAARHCLAIASQLKTRYFAEINLVDETLQFPIITHIAGYFNRWSESTLLPGTPLQLKRDYQNQFDKNAIKIMAPLSEGPLYYGRHVGFIPRNIAAQLAQLVDRGAKFNAEIVSYAQHPTASRIEVVLTLQSSSAL